MMETDRRDQVLALYVLGYSHAEMASELGVGISTIKEYLDRVREGKGISTRRELVALARNRRRPEGMTFWEWMDYQAGVSR